MSFQCYTPRASLRSASIGGLFILAGGVKRVIPDQWLMQVELLEETCLLRLSYTFCTIEVAGEDLDAIFEDPTVGKLGAIQAAPTEAAPAGQPWVTSIVVVPPATQSLPPSEQEFFDA